MTTIKNILIDGKASDLQMEGGRIVRIAPSGMLSAENGNMDLGEVVDGKGRTAVPGFVNMHAHSGMSLMRGIWEDMKLAPWLQHVWDLEEKIDSEYIYWATRAACLEMIRTGTTCFNDQYWLADDAQRAVKEAGLRASLSYVFLDRFDSNVAAAQKDECIRMFERSKEWGETINFTVSCHAVFTVSEETLIWAAEFARKNGLRLHIHILETEKELIDCKASHGGLTPVEYLDKIGFLGPDVISAHSLWLSEHDIEILGNRGVTCVHNINSNLKLSSGYKFKADELSRAGANVTLGTDGSASSNNLDMLEAMKTSAMLQKAWRNDPTSMSVDNILQIATANGAKGLGLDCGRIEEGALADFILVDTDNCFFLSPGSFNANFIYSAHSDCIADMVCNGRFIMRDRQVDGERETLEGAKRQISRLFNK